MVKNRATFKRKCAVAIPGKCPIPVSYVRKLEAHQGACSLSQSSYVIWWTPPARVSVLHYLSFRLTTTVGYSRYPVSWAIRFAAFGFFCIFSAGVGWQLTNEGPECRSYSVDGAGGQIRTTTAKWDSDIGWTWVERPGRLASSSSRLAGCRSFTPPGRSLRVLRMCMCSWLKVRENMEMEHRNLTKFTVQVQYRGRGWTDCILRSKVKG